MGLPRRGLLVLVGIATLLVYWAGAAGGVLLLGWLLADPPGLGTLAVVFTLVVLVGAYAGYRLGTVRLVTSLDATVLPPRRAPELYRRLARIAEQMDIEQPPVFVAQLGAPNALSLGGPRNGIVVVDRQLLELLTIDELEGILAHELAHIESYDTFVNTLVLTALRLAAGLVGLVVFPVFLFLLGIDRATAWAAGRPSRQRVGLAAVFQYGITLALGLLFSVVTLGYLSYSRKREFAADARAAGVTGKPRALARALSKIHRATNPRHGLLSLLYVHEDENEDARRLLSTHPPIEARIDRLRERAGHSARAPRLGRLHP